MPYVETRKACQSRICYKSHSHPTFSIGAIDAGQSHFSSSFAQDQLIQSGSVVVIPAHVQHSCNPLPDQAWSYQMMHLDAAWLATLIEELHQDIALETGRQAIHFPQLKPTIVHDVKVYDTFTALNRLLFSEQISVLEKEQYLVKILAEMLIPNFHWEKIHSSHYFQKHLPDLLECLEDNIENLSLQVISEKMNMSRYALIRLFKHYFGLTPHAYQLNYKVNQARQRLREKCDLAQLAYELDFTDQSHFHRVFKQHTGITPKQYYKKS
ncbi:AraC family transcriptional regulator [Acinetobacter sp. C26M]|uniref:AraC family transcriptional regulator n=1 Tax=unclassified Acinetobacter TaxID=196816 RepID=UPI002036F450|nr:MULTISPECIES: AraC family transcriptional regulator [unclassified Acinetobacter]USA45228.1 AraC family transcriptional regulator [Acinetobacter sp. C26M]USA48730.1 AraC family transcriptional regulator [Acinetobacter sp. C26G]